MTIARTTLTIITTMRICNCISAAYRQYHKTVNENMDFIFNQLPLIKILCDELPIVVP